MLIYYLHEKLKCGLQFATPYNTNRHLQNESIRVSKDKVVRR